MMLKFIAFLAFFIAVANAYQMNLKMSSNDFTKKFTKAFGIIGMGASILGSSAVLSPSPAFADGASSISTVYRGRNYYGPKILKLEEAVNKGDFSAFEDKKVASTFKLFISETTSRNTLRDQEVRGAENRLQDTIFEAAKTKDASKLKTAYAEFIKVADLKSDYKLSEKGASDSSGFAPTYGTERGYNAIGIYDKKK